MACTKPYIVLLFLLSGILLMGELANNAEAQFCPQYCLDVKYMTCKSTGREKLPGKCNCCIAGKGCTLHLADGTKEIC